MLLLWRIENFVLAQTIFLETSKSTTSDFMPKKKRKIGHKPQPERTFVSFTVVVKKVLLRSLGAQHR